MLSFALHFPTEFLSEVVKGTSMLLYLYSPIGDQFREPVNEIQPIIIGPEYFPSLDPPDAHMMQRPWRV